MQYNTKVIRTSVGEINVVNGMKKHNSVIGGEGNGGVILKNSHLGRDAFVASAIILNHLATNDLLMSEAIANIPAPSKKMKGKVIEDIEKGYYLNDKVIRFAKVVVGQ